MQVIKGEVRGESDEKKPPPPRVRALVSALTLRQSRHRLTASSRCVRVRLLFCFFASCVPTPQFSVSVSLVNVPFYLCFSPFSLSRFFQSALLVRVAALCSPSSSDSHLFPLPHIPRRHHSPHAEVVPVSVAHRTIEKDDENAHTWRALSPTGNRESVREDDLSVLLPGGADHHRHDHHDIERHLLPRGPFHKDRGHTCCRPQHRP